MKAQKRADRFLAKSSHDTIFWVPALWWYGLSNGLTMARRHQRITETDRIRLLELYGGLPIQTELDLGVAALWRFHTIAQEHALSTYDAAYLDLSQRRGLGLATQDHRLIRAARKAGVKVIRS